MIRQKGEGKRTGQTGRDQKKKVKNWAWEKKKRQEKGNSHTTGAETAIKKKKEKAQPQHGR